MLGCRGTETLPNQRKDSRRLKIQIQDKVTLEMWMLTGVLFSTDAMNTSEKLQQRSEIKRNENLNVHIPTCESAEIVY